MEVGVDKKEDIVVCLETVQKTDENPEEQTDEDKSNTLTRENVDVNFEKGEEMPKTAYKNPEESEKLHGWLHHRARGIGNLKGIRKRWFVFGDDNCKLYFYRDPQDLLPVGEINISTASFYFDGGNTEKPGQFQIKYVFFLSLDICISIKGLP